MPLLSWRGWRTRFSIPDFFATQKLKNKLDVVHLSVSPEEELFLYWPEENTVYSEGEGANKLLDNLLHDIIHGCLDETVWRDPPIYFGERIHHKKKKVVEGSDDDFVDPPRKKNKVTKKKRKTTTGGAEIGDGTVEGIMQLFGELSVKVETLGLTMGRGFRGLEGEVTTKVDGMLKRLVGLEGEVTVLKKNQLEYLERDAESTTANEEETG